MIRISFTEQQLATVLAALRMWQQTTNRVENNDEDGLLDVATFGGEFAPLDDAAIDELCERIDYCLSNRRGVEPMTTSG